MLTSALTYSRVYGAPVFTVYSVKDGVCGCSKGEWCESAGKHPQTPRGFKDATTDEALIRELWAENPEANIGVPTGAVSGLVVLDVDGPEGEEALKGRVKALELRAEDGTLFTRDENSWLVRNLLESPEGIEVRFAYNEQTDKLIYEGTATRATIRTTGWEI